ncbi:MAG: hypothetical protein H5T69_03265, partial [Chloroflexi bacterium]|nr:hypothetical protein [Chloroflexota bacterium]
MIPRLRHVLAPAYLYAQNEAPSGHWSAGLVGIFVLLLFAGAAGFLRQRSRPESSPLASKVAMDAALLGLIALSGHVYGTGAWSARIWYLCAWLIACVTAILAWLPINPRAPRALVAALALQLEPDGPFFAPIWQGLLLALHLGGLVFTTRWAGNAPLVLALLCLSLASWATRRRPSSFPLCVGVLTPLLLTWTAEALRWLINEGLDVPTELYRAFPYADPWSPWFDRRVPLTLGLSWMMLLTARLIALRLASETHRQKGESKADALEDKRSWRYRPMAWLGGALLILSSLWYLATAGRLLSHGATGSDPFCYLQMAEDIALRGTPLHAFPLAEMARQAQVDLWPIVHVGYHPPGQGDRAPTVWPIGWPALLAPWYRLGAESLVLWGAPVCVVLAALSSAFLTWQVLSSQNDSQPSTRSASSVVAAGIAAAILLTSDEALRRSLVPMADAAAQLGIVIMMAGLARAVRTDRLRWSALAGAAFALAYWVRHPLLPAGLAGLAAACILPRPWPRRGHHMLIFASAALLLALPDLFYHYTVWSSPWVAESSEWALISWRYIPQTISTLTRDGLFRRAEFGYLWPLVLIGLCAQANKPAGRRQVLFLLAGLLPTLLFNLAYRAVRLRDLTSLFPWPALWAGWGIVTLWKWACHHEGSCQRALIVGLVLFFLAARTAPTLELVRQGEVRPFGYLSADQRRELARLAEALPSKAVVLTGLSSGAVARYTER